MNPIDVLTVEKRKIEQEISAAKSKLKKLETAYDSLCRFKGDYQRSQGDFSLINSKKSQALASLTKYNSKNNACNKYYHGMKGSLNGIGGKIVGGSFLALGFMIDSKLTEYRIAISATENKITLLGSKLEIVNSDIRTAQLSEEG